MNHHTGADYVPMAKKYAETVDTKPWNAHYDRPAVLSLLPDLARAKVLDAGCGSGWYAEQFINRGAEVTAFDFNAEFVDLTRARLSGRAQVHQADLAEPLSFAATGEFDVVVSALVLHYIRDWPSVLSEFNRVLKAGGILVFSTHHPFMDWKLFKTEDYFATELLHDEWEMGKVRFYRRPLTTMSKDLLAAGFAIERLLEPTPTEDFHRVHPEGYERVLRNPWFLCIRARKT